MLILLAFIGLALLVVAWAIFVHAQETGRVHQAMDAYAAEMRVWITLMREMDMPRHREGDN